MSVTQREDPSGDQAAIDALVGRFFSVFDNRGRATPRLDDVVDCFTEKATIVRRSPGGADVCTILEFALPRIQLLTEGTLRDFHEWETSSTTRIFDGIATRVSRYAKSWRDDGRDCGGAGTKCFQLVDLAGRWRIASLAWVDDDA